MHKIMLQTRCISLPNKKVARNVFHRSRKASLIVRNSSRGSATSTHTSLSSNASQKKAMHSSASMDSSACISAVHHLDALKMKSPVSKLQLKTETDPTNNQLRTLFISSAIPMVGFGFMDNFIMIQAGGYIDATLGVKMGLATMTAAAMGQVVSDVSGVIFGGVLEQSLSRVGLIRPSNLTNFQRQLPISRYVVMGGSVLGVMFGCALGASSLLLLDLDSKKHNRRGAELHDLLSAMFSMDDGINDNCSLDSQYCTLYVIENRINQLSKEKDHKVKVQSIKEADTNSLVMECARSGSLVMENVSRDLNTDEVHRSILCVPVKDKNGELLAIIEMKNKKAGGHGAGFFTEHDEKLAKMMAFHLGIFFEKLSDYNA